MERFIVRNGEDRAVIEEEKCCEILEGRRESKIEGLELLRWEGQANSLLKFSKRSQKMRIDWRVSNDVNQTGVAYSCSIPATKCCRLSSSPLDISPPIAFER